MAIRVALNHKTRYRYDREVWLSPQIVRLHPAPHCRTPIPAYSLKVTPEDPFINWQQDPYSNRLARLVFPKKTREFSVEVDLVAEMTVINPFDFFLESSAEAYPFHYDPLLERELAPYLQAMAPGPALSVLIRDLRQEKVRTVDYLVSLNQRIHEDIRYVIRLEPGIQSAEESLAKRTGSCRDSAWLLVQLLRQLGLASRFVSGYLIQLAPDVKSLDGPSGTDRDFTDLHAWAEVFIPGAGWIGMDPTSGLLAGEGHLPLACSADPVTAAAITGYFSAEDEAVTKADPAALNGQRPETKCDFEFSMSVTRIHEDPRVTRPYNDESWNQIEALGRRVDQDLSQGDVRLTMGGEPTFVSIDDMDGAEWTTQALGRVKYERADVLIRRLKERFAPGGFLHHGQGKWYPGESLPRWSLGLFWRKDGHPVWRDPAWVADEARPGGHGEAEALRFMIRLGEILGVAPEDVIPGYEDTWYYLWKERRLPVNVDPFDAKLADPEDRVRLARVFERGLDRATGYALPLRREAGPGGAAVWRSGPWSFRQGRMYLVPGDSAMGFRLPLESLPWVAPSEMPRHYDRDPQDPRPPLPVPAERLGQRFLRSAAEAMPRSDRSEQAGRESVSGVIRTAVCVEGRAGVIRVFLPPQAELEDYLALVEAVEAVASELKLPVLVEGYPPPADPRLHTLKVTPDPGVIEVNTQPVASWDELVRNTTLLYEEARLSRLVAEKFMLDGRHTGTGGGNHIVVGGATPADSPCSGGPTFFAASSGIGIITRRCPTFSPDSSWGPPAKHPGWTKPGMNRSTSWKLRSDKSRDPRPVPPGRSTASFAIS